MKYAILYTDQDGESHFKDGDLEFESVNFAPPAPPVELTSYIQASRLVFFRLPSGPGEVFLLEDTWGKGHKSRITSKEDFVAAIVQLA
jgi:hypothetical protein